MFALRSSRVPGHAGAAGGHAHPVPPSPLVLAPPQLARAHAQDRARADSVAHATRAEVKVRRAAAKEAIIQTIQADDVFESAEEEITISLKDLEQHDESHTVKCRIVVPYYVTKPGQQLMMVGSVPALGKGDNTKAMPLTWREGHMHTAELELPAGKLVEAKLVLFENGKPVYTENKSRDILLMPGVSGSDSSNDTGLSPTGSMDGIPQASSSSAKPSGNGAKGANGKAGSQKPEFQILCVWDHPDVTEVLRLPVMLQPRDPKDDTTLCKLVVLPDSIKLEGRQRPVLVGNIPELGAWDPANGVKLMRQVGGHWTCRIALPLHTEPVQAKVVIVDANGKAVAWEPGTTNRTLTSNASGGIVGRPGTHMLIFTCQWSNPGVTPIIAVPVEYEPQDKEHLKQLDAAYREIAVMRQAMTAKARQAQQLEQDLHAARKVERELRAESATLRKELDRTYEELDTALAHRDEAREQAELSVGELNEARKVVDIARREISSLRDQIRTLQVQLQQLQANGMLAAAVSSSNAASAAAVPRTANGHANGHSNGHAHAHSNGNGNGASHSNGNGNGKSTATHQPASGSGSNWRGNWRSG